MKHLSKILAFALISLGVGTLVAHAQNYAPLAPLPGTINVNDTTAGVGTTNISLYLSGMVKLLIALGAALAVLFAIIGGTQYVAAGISPDAKSGAKERITNALIGLAIILTSYLLLNSINPKLVDVSFELKPVTVTPAPSVAGVRAVAPEAAAWGDDSAVRDVLGNGTNVQVTLPSCKTVDQQYCTSVYGLDGNAISGLRLLDTNCAKLAQTPCGVVVTGGTEYWLHRSHNDNRKVDLRKDTTLDGYITRNGPSSITSCGVSSDPHYQTDGATYVDEPNRDSNGNITGTGRHWHVCY